jgi:hypothetical protein
MPILYLFSLQNLNRYPDEKNYAVISEKNEMSLDELYEGASTNFFSINETDIIITKQVVPFLINVFNDIVSNYNSESKIRLEKENQHFWCIIDGKKYNIGLNLEQSDYIVFDYVAILKSI